MSDVPRESRYILSATIGASVGDAFLAQFWTQALLRRGRHVLTASVAAALSMGVGVGVAALT